MGRRKRSFHYAGQKFASMAERDFAVLMTEQLIDWIYEPEKLPWIPPKKTYTPDFKVQRKDGSYFYVEYKGYLRATDRTKMREIKKQYPDLDLRFIFQRATKKLYKGAKSTYGEWATKMGFPWAVGRIPDEWMEEAHPVQSGVHFIKTRMRKVKEVV